MVNYYTDSNGTEHVLLRSNNNHQGHEFYRDALDRALKALAIAVHTGSATAADVLLASILADCGVTDYIQSSK